MNKDLKQILDGWDYDPDNNTRVIDTEDGRSVLQVRLPLGLEQYEIDGRPDGVRPFDHETVLEFVEEKLQDYVSTHASGQGFSIDHEDFVRLQNEGILYYYRYLLLFQINDFERVVRDTDHNLRLCRLLAEYCPEDEDKNSVLQFQPYIIRMHAMARSMHLAQQKLHSEASEILEVAIKEIEELDSVPSPVFQFEKSRSVTYLTGALKQMRQKDSDPRKVLEDELARALEEENYERAAELRDRLRNLIDKAQSA